MNRRLRISGVDPVVRGHEHVFRGWNEDREPVLLHIASSQWNSIQAAPPTVIEAHETLEMLAGGADWMPNPEHGGWTIRIRLPMLMK